MAQGIRFTTRAGFLYAIVVAALQDGVVRIRTLRKPAGEIVTVQLLSANSAVRTYRAVLKWK